MSEADDKIRCDACPVMCYIRPGMTGACDRYANDDGLLVRVDPHVLLDRTVERGGQVVAVRRRGGRLERRHRQRAEPFRHRDRRRHDLSRLQARALHRLVQVDGVDMVTVVTEGIFSYCGVKVKIDTDRHLGAECATVRAEGEPVGHVTTGEYGSQMLSLGGVNHLTQAARRRAASPARRCSISATARPVELAVDGGATVVVAGRQAADRQRRARGAHARRLRLGDDRHVREAMVRQGRRSRRRRRPHHRRPVRASGRQAARRARHRHQHEGPALDARPLFPCRRARHRLGRHQHHRSARRSSPASIRRWRGRA